MPKLIDYPRTNYTGAWELAEVVDDTGGKCAIDTAARKLNRKVSGSFKAIIGSAVKFGLMTSKRELLSTTTLFKRIKHAYDKQEELLFHREAFLTPPLFTQICRKFRGRELPIQMLDVMLIREFGVEEINAQGVAKAFVEGCRMCALLDDHNIMADIDALNAQRAPRRELASPTPNLNTFSPERHDTSQDTPPHAPSSHPNPPNSHSGIARNLEQLFKREEPASQPAAATDRDDAIANLFGLNPEVAQQPRPIETFNAPELPTANEPVAAAPPTATLPETIPLAPNSLPAEKHPASYQMKIIGPGVNTALDVTDEEDITIAIALLEKIRRQLRADR